MKGKKIDAEFLTKFINECIAINKTNTDDIVKEAKDQIKNIEDKIREIENLKIKRSRLLDVVYYFGDNYKNNNNNKNEIKILSYYNLQYPDICKFICNTIKNNPISIEALYKSQYSKEDLLFCIKQLIEYKIINKIGNSIVKSDSYSEYMKNIFKE